MKLVPVDPTLMGKKKTNSTKIIQILEEFLSMNVECVRVDDPPEYTAIDGFYKSCKYCVARMHYPVQVIMQQRQVYFKRLTSIELVQSNVKFVSTSMSAINE